MNIQMVLSMMDITIMERNADKERIHSRIKCNSTLEVRNVDIDKTF